MAYINLLSSTETSLRCNVDGLDSSYTGAIRKVYWYLDREYQDAVTLSNQVSSGGAYTFRGLDPGTEYYVSCVITIATEAWEVDLGEYFSTDSPSLPVPDKWDWFGWNGPEYNANASLTTAAYYAVTGNGSTTDFSHLVWNDLCAKTLEVRNVDGFDWDDTYASYSETQMTANSREMTAVRMNSLRHNVNTSLPKVSKGGIVYGYYFTQISNAINSWIDYL